MIPTAEEYIKEFNSHDHGCGCRWRDLVAMRFFAQLHVDAALKAAAENARAEMHLELNGDEYPIVDKESILNAYPKENIQ